MISTRIRNFRSIMNAASNQPTDWLISACKQPGKYQSKLATLACVRVIASRTESRHLPYRDRMQAAKKAIWG